MRTYYVHRNAQKMCKSALIPASQLASMCFVAIAVSRNDQITFKWTFKTQLRKTTSLCFFLLLLLLLIPCGYFFHMQALYKKCAYMNWVFVFGRMTYDATFSKHSAIKTTLIMKQKKTELLTFCICFHRIDLIWSHTHEFISNARSLSLSPSFAHDWDFFKNSLLHFIE